MWFCGSKLVIFKTRSSESKNGKQFICKYVCVYGCLCVGELVTHSRLGRRHNHNLLACVAASTSWPLDDGDEDSAAAAAAGVSCPFWLLLLVSQSVGFWAAPPSDNGAAAAAPAAAAELLMVASRVLQAPPDADRTPSGLKGSTTTCSVPLISARQNGHPLRSSESCPAKKRVTKRRTNLFKSRSRQITLLINR